VFFLHVPSRMDRPDQRIANGSHSEEDSERIKDQAVDLIVRDTFGHARIMQVVDD
jgi:hypothetical protein